MFDDDAHEGEDIPPPPLSEEEFLRWRSPRFGDRNPTDLTNPLWDWMARTRHNAYVGNNAFNGPSPFDSGPMWCFDRFGCSGTHLPDGRLVHIAGEHEDHYDPDFCIYNDVVLAEADGRLRFLAYPKDVFPPTDFHSATLVGNRIIVIGNLGYPEHRRPGFTPVYALNLDTWAMQELHTQGEMPGWISRHQAKPSTDGTRILLSGGQVMDDAHQLWTNTHAWELELSTGTWRQATQQSWPQWLFTRQDGKRSLLWDMRHALWTQGVGWDKELAEQMQHIEQELGFRPSLELLHKLYRYAPDVLPLPETEDDDAGLRRFAVAGTPVCFKEDTFTVHVVAQGPLDAEQQRALETGVSGQLAALHGVPWVAQRYQAQDRL